MSTIKEWAEVIQAILVIVGIPIGLYQYYHAVHKEQHDREYATYDALDQKFLDYQLLCMNNPDLDIHDVADSSPKTLTPQEQKKELIAFTILFSIFERAFLMYADQSDDYRKRQWVGWDEYIRLFAARANFQRAWKASGSTFDAHFEEYMKGLIS